MPVYYLAKVLHFMKFPLQFIGLSLALLLIAVGIGAWTFIKSARQYPPTMPHTSFYSLTANTLNGETFSFESLKGKRVLIVNTASKCGYTPQYEGLESLHQQFGGDDFVVIGFPCNDFGMQEPGNAEEIGAFCSSNFGVSFDLMEKIHVGGKDQHPVYEWLCSENLNGVSNHKVNWNFHKFLIDSEGRLVASLRSGVKPTDEEITSFAQGQ